MARFCQLDYVAGKKTFETVLNVYRILGEREEMFRVYKLVCDKDDVTKALVTVMINNPYQNPRIIDHFYSKERFINMDLEVRNILDKKLDKLSVHKKVSVLLVIFILFKVFHKGSNSKDKHIVSQCT